MTKKIYFAFIATLFFICGKNIAQTPLQSQPTLQPYNFNNIQSCLPDAERAIIESRIQANRAMLVAQNKIPTSGFLSTAHPLFRWPLSPKGTLTDYSYYTISNYVDLDTLNPGHLLDWNCGTRTYDISGYNHTGIDISLWPFGWYKMEHSLVKIVAAAPGILLDKHDGEYDHQCSFNNNQPNYVIIQHADGSVAWYFHMKTGSVTTKPIGASIAESEVIGYVGSSGSSTGPHLHFEVHDAANKVIEPFYGTCNNTTSNTWWKSQKKYNDRYVNKIIVTQSSVSMPSCSTETFDESQKVCTENYIYFYSFYRNWVAGDTITYKIFRPDNTLYSQGNYIATNTYTAAYLYWYFYFYPNEQTGQWSYVITFNKKTYSQLFKVYKHPSTISVTGNTSLCPNDSVILTSSSDYGNKWSTGATTQSIIVKVAGTFNVIVTNACGVDTSANVVISSGCSVPTGTSTTNITNSGAKLNWSLHPCAKGYQAQYRIKGTAIWTSLNLYTNVGNTTLTGLTAGTQYEWRVKTKCAVTPSIVWSAFTSAKTFTTGGPRLAFYNSDDIKIFPNPSDGFFKITL